MKKYTVEIIVVKNLFSLSKTSKLMDIKIPKMLFVQTSIIDANNGD